MDGEEETHLDSVCGIHTDDVVADTPQSDRSIPSDAVAANVANRLGFENPSQANLVARDPDGFPIPQMAARFKSWQATRPGTSLAPPPSQFGPKDTRIKQTAEVTADSTGSREVGPGSNAAGGSQLRFMSLMACGKNKAAERPITREEVAKHTSLQDAWTILNGKVYNLGPYMEFHPGGKKILLSMAAGKDCTAAFNKHHPWVNYEMLLRDLYLGPLAHDSSGAYPTIEEAQE